MDRRLVAHTSCSSLHLIGKYNVTLQNADGRLREFFNFVFILNESSVENSFNAIMKCCR